MRQKRKWGTKNNDGHLPISQQVRVVSKHDGCILSIVSSFETCLVHQVLQEIHHSIQSEHYMEQAEHSSPTQKLEVIPAHISLPSKRCIVKGGAHMCFIDSLDIHASMKHV